ncbi:hypothetical protein SAMN05444364_10919 [Prevotella scopos JCM 17725]|uniref:Uncharacterized protein n=1 Tax=Prevotella scopos JCM 17725 TaxID=1236518 RepID=A0AAX2F2X6_9BACT|nr:hypothetical protein SAMN05444364_10919 [Prevotella scopos JCM 17725]
MTKIDFSCYNVKLKKSITSLLSVYKYYYLDYQVIISILIEFNTNKVSVLERANRLYIALFPLNNKVIL